MDIALLRQSFEIVVAREPLVVQRFYQILFQRYPSLRPLFRGPAQAQAEMLTAALAAVLEHLEDATWLGRTLEQLGEKHLAYGVREEMYPWVGECLLAALSEAAADAWSPAVEAAWKEAYAAIAGAMIAGARKAAVARTLPAA